MTLLARLGVRTRLILLVLVALAPAFLLLFYVTAQLRADARREAEHDAVRLAGSASDAQQRQIEAAGSLLAVLSRLPEVRAGDVPACEAIFGDLLAQSHGYANIYAAGTDGDTYCSAAPLAADARSVADWPHVRRAVETRALAVSDYLIGRATGRPVVSLAYPITDGNRTLGVVGVSLDLGDLSQAGPTDQLPAGAVFDIFDAHGTLLARYPGPEAWIGTTAADAPLVTAVLGRHSGSIETAGLDGVRRLYGFTPLTSAADGVYVAVGIPTHSAFAHADHVERIGVAGLISAAALALGAAWVGADVFLLRPLRRLKHTAARLAAGRLGARTHLPHDAGEIGDLALAFDRMAEAIQQRDEALRGSESQLAAVVDAVEDGVLILDTEGRCTLANHAAQVILGCEPHALEGVTSDDASWQLTQPDGTPLTTDEHPFAQVRRLDRTLYDICVAARRNDGTHARLAVTAAPLRDPAGGFAGAVLCLKDLSDQARAGEQPAA